ncbi:MAG: sigma-70 family RNA polymerase sigma factor [Pyrinomonadaceae bacterium]
MERTALMTEKSIGPELLAECRFGNREAMRSLFVLHQKRVYSVALNFFGGNQALAQDITQQVFLKLLTRLDAFRGDAEFATWIYRITVNACVDETRRLRRFLNFGELFGSFEPRVKQNADKRLQSEQVADEVQRALKTLKPKFRLPLVLKYVEDLSYQEIAEVLQCSVGTVSSRIHRGHKMMAEKLGHLKDQV